MKGDQRNPHPPENLLKFMSINVGRGGVTHEIALSRACELQIDVLLIQEPWWSGSTKSHPYFDRHLPHSDMGNRPRTVTYTRIDRKNIHASQEFPLSIPTGDYCWVVVNGITFLNVYKAPQDATVVETLLKWSPPMNSIAVGDFNSLHWAWQLALQFCMDKEKIRSVGLKHISFLVSS